MLRAKQALSIFYNNKINLLFIISITLKLLYELTNN
nr:MAG TPA: hypothetical protein [Caudoviricetes sp.]